MGVSIALRFSVVGELLVRVVAQLTLIAPFTCCTCRDQRRNEIGNERCGLWRSFPEGVTLCRVTLEELGACDRGCRFGLLGCGGFPIARPTLQ